MTTSPDTQNSTAPACTDERCHADLKAFADSELSPLRRRAVQDHLRHCAACREELETMKTITERLRTSENGTAPAALSAGLRSRLLATAPASTAPVAPPLWRRQPGLVFGGGGAALLASVVAFGVLQSGTPKSGGMAFRAPAAASEAAPVAADAPAAPGVASAVSASAPSASQAQVADSSGAAAPAAASAPRVEARAERDDSAPPAFQIAVQHRVVSAKATSQARVYGSEGQFESTAPAAEPAPADTERQVHREASLGLQVRGLEATSDRIEEMVKAGGGFVAGNNLSTDEDGYKSADLSLRVPTKDFDSTMVSLAKLGNVTSKSVSGEDITDKVSDATSAEQVLVNDVQETENKLKNQSMSERRTGEKEAELRDVRIRLAQTRARLGLLRKMASLSTINITLTEKPVKKAEKVTPGFWSDFGDTNRSAMATFQSAVRVPIVLIIWILAFSPIWAPLVLLYRYASIRSLAKATVIENGEVC